MTTSMMWPVGSGEPDVVIVPGFGDSGAGHWQTRWQDQNQHLVRISPASWTEPDLGDWLSALERAADHRRPVLVAHSLGCLLSIEWARRNPQAVAGLFLVALPDPVAASFPLPDSPFARIDLEHALPVPALVIAARMMSTAGRSVLLRLRALLERAGSRWGRLGTSTRTADLGLGVSWLRAVAYWSPTPRNHTTSPIPTVAEFRLRPWAEGRLDDRRSLAPFGASNSIPRCSWYSIQTASTSHSRAKSEKMKSKPSPVTVRARTLDNLRCGRSSV